MAKLRRPAASTSRITADLQPYSDEVRRLTVTVHELLRQSGQVDVNGRANLGNYLGQIRTRLSYGQWHRWIESEFPYSRKSADSYIQLYYFSRSDPDRFRRIAPFGATKLYLLMRLPPKLLDRLLTTPQHLVPSSGERKSLDVIKLAELMEVVAVLNGKPLPPHDDADTLVRTSRRRTRALLNSIDQLIEHRTHVDQDEAQDLYDDLIDATHRLAFAFTLDD